MLKAERNLVLLGNSEGGIRSGMILCSFWPCPDEVFLTDFLSFIVRKAAGSSYRNDE